ncbi:unnamed protein product [Clonostachys rhizophaga]|uniref:Uncharacterized protein n=1 Tax=Clonostachys rhizophaga TaxID=160324 RepID=A0A9N9YG78_9HYPO|nr:unnamed protein product [Clonostachys rhizophaga]
MSLIVTLKVRPPLVIPSRSDDQCHESITVWPAPLQPAETPPAMDADASPGDSTSPGDSIFPGDVASPSDTTSPGAVASPGDEAKQVGDEPKTETQTPSNRRPPHVLAPDVLLCLRSICRKWEVKNLYEFFTIPQGDPYFHDYLPARIRPTSLTRDGLQKLRYISEHCDRDEARLRIASTSMNQPEQFQGLVRPCVLDWVIASLQTDKGLVNSDQQPTKMPAKKRMQKKRQEKEEQKEQEQEQEAEMEKQKEKEMEQAAAPGQIICLSDSDKQSNSPSSAPANTNAEPTSEMASPSILQNQTGNQQPQPHVIPARQPREGIWIIPTNQKLPGQTSQAQMPPVQVPPGYLPPGYLPEAYLPPGFGVFHGSWHVSPNPRPDALLTTPFVHRPIPYRQPPPSGTVQIAPMPRALMSADHAPGAPMPGFHMLDVPLPGVSMPGVSMLVPSMPGAHTPGTHAPVVAMPGAPMSRQVNTVQADESEIKAMEDEKARLLALINFREERMRILSLYGERMDIHPPPSLEDKVKAAYAMLKALDALVPPPNLRSIITTKEGAWGQAVIQPQLNRLRKFVEDPEPGEENPFDSRVSFLSEAHMKTEMVTQHCETDPLLADMRKLVQKARRVGYQMILLRRTHIQLVHPQRRRLPRQPEIRLPHVLAPHADPRLRLLAVLVGDGPVGDGVDDVHAELAVLLGDGLGDHAHAGTRGPVRRVVLVRAQGSQRPREDDGAFDGARGLSEGRLAAVLGVHELEGLLGEDDGAGGVGLHGLVEGLGRLLEEGLAGGVADVVDGQGELEVLEGGLRGDLGKGGLEAVGVGVGGEGLEDAAVGRDAQVRGEGIEGVLVAGEEGDGHVALLGIGEDTGDAGA